MRILVSTIIESIILMIIFSIGNSASGYLINLLPIDASSAITLIFNIIEWSLAIFTLIIYLVYLYSCHLDKVIRRKITKIKNKICNVIN